MKRFSDFADENILDGDKKAIEDILNKEIIILNYRIRESRYSDNRDGKYLTLQVEIDGKRYVIFTGSDVLVEQLKRYSNQLPFVSTIRKIKKYFTLT
jgi:hypothetical protein